MNWKELILARRITLFQWLLPPTIAAAVFFYEIVIVPNVQILWPQGFFFTEIFFYGIVGPVAAFFILRWFQRWQNEKEHAEQQLQNQEKYLATIKIEEGRRVAHHLHREVLPNLAIVSYTIENTCKRIDPKAPTTKELKGALRTLRETLRDLRDKIDALRRGIPLLSLEKGTNLVDEMHRRAKEFEALMTLRVHVSAKGKRTDFSYEFESALARIMGEAFNNVALHAQAKNLWVNFDVSDPEQVVLSVVDDGGGFNPQERSQKSNSVGITHMSDEANRFGGQLLIESARSNGTIITAVFPINEMILSNGKD